MHNAMLVAFGLYCVVLVVIGFVAYRRSRKAADFILGSRSLSYWVTALAAHASDMSGWLFMGFPAAVFMRGLPEMWTAIGLLFFMWLNWRLVAPKIRSITERYHSLTLPSFFEKRFNDQSGMVRAVGGFFCLLFFMFYISAGLVVLGHLFEAIFNVGYLTGISIGSLVIFYILLGGYLSIAWIDFFQGMFLLVMIILVPAVALRSLNGGWTAVLDAARLHHKPLQVLPEMSLVGIGQVVMAAAGWGLGYFGMPHIVTKFMGIRDVGQMRKAMAVGLSWQAITLTAAIAVGLVGIAFFPNGLVNNELIFVEMTKALFTPFLAGLILCAIVASAINVMGAQVLASASVLAEDLFKRFMHADSLDQLDRRVAWASRLSVLLVCALAFVVAFYNRQQTIYDLVYYAWAGLGCSFGPLVLVALHTKIQSRWAALAGMLTGGLTAAVWPQFGSAVPAMIPGFMLSLLAIWLVEKIANRGIVFCGEES
jgi:sodium/proline symporter